MPVEQLSSLPIVLPDPDKTVVEHRPITRGPSQPPLKQHPPTLLHHTCLQTNSISISQEKRTLASIFGVQEIQ
jgi:hypothetical protein